MCSVINLEFDKTGTEKNKIQDKQISNEVLLTRLQ